MAAPNPGANEVVRSIRRKERPMGEILNTETRIVQSQGHGQSCYINLTRYATQTLDIESGDEMAVKTCGDRLIIEPVEDTDE